MATEDDFEIKSAPLRERPGYRTDPSTELGRDMEALCQKHHLAGAVLVSFDRADGGRIGTKAICDDTRDSTWFKALDHLAREILRAMDDGTFVPPTADPSETVRQSDGEDATTDRCHSCGQPIADGDKHMTADDVDLCGRCFRGCFLDSDKEV